MTKEEAKLQKQGRKRRPAKQQNKGPKQKTALEEKYPIQKIEEKPDEELEDSHRGSPLKGKLRSAIEETKEEEDSMDNESLLVLSNHIPEATHLTMLEITADGMLNQTPKPDDNQMSLFYTTDPDNFVDNFDEEDQCSDPEIEKNIVSQLNIVDKEVYRTNMKELKALDTIAEKYKTLQEDYRSKGSQAIMEGELFSKGASTIEDPAHKLKQMFETDNSII